MVVLSGEGGEIGIEAEAASGSMGPFEEWPVEHEEEASRGKCEVVGANIETECEEMDAGAEEQQSGRIDWERS